MRRGILGGLLATAAGLTLAGGAQAADMPVKAKPVEYVKICSAYGAGFYYIPGTDICLRVGGYVFVEAGVKGRSGAAANVDSRNDNYLNWRSRGHVILDARNNTSYGTLRAYFVGGVSYVSPSSGAPATSGTISTVSTASLDRAFIQFAGLTVGYTESFFSFGGAYSIVSSMSLPWDWQTVFAYTAQLGNGISATLSAEDSQIRRMGVATTPFTGVPAGEQHAGQNMPDIVANLRVDQAWGSAQIMGAMHEVKLNTAALAVTTNSTIESKWGYAIGAGLELKTPQTGNPNNSFLVQAQWTKGALEYTGISQSPATTGTGLAITRGSLGAAGDFGPQADFFDAYARNGELSLTEAWSAYAAYRHYWTPMLRTAFSAGVTDVKPGGNAASGAAGHPDARIWQGHVSTIWSPVAGLDLSLDLVYSNLKTGSCTADSVAGGFACDTSKGFWTAWTRIRRNF